MHTAKWWCLLEVTCELPARTRTFVFMNVRKHTEHLKWNSVVFAVKQTITSSQTHHTRANVSTGQRCRTAWYINGFNAKGLNSIGRQWLTWQRAVSSLQLNYWRCARKFSVLNLNTRQPEVNHIQKQLRSTRIEDTTWRDRQESTQFGSNKAFFVTYSC